MKRRIVVGRDSEGGCVTARPTTATGFVEETGMPNPLKTEFDLCDPGVVAAIADA